MDDFTNLMSTWLGIHEKFYETVSFRIGRCACGREKVHTFDDLGLTWLVTVPSIGETAEKVHGFVWNEI
jgi:hypothetical protein